MKFKFTMNMPSRNGNPVHQVIGEHSAESLEAMLGELGQSDFVLVDEFYVDSAHGSAPGASLSLRHNGQVILNAMFIGKVAVLEP